MNKNLYYSIIYLLATTMMGRAEVAPEARQKSIPSGDVVNPQWRESHSPIARERIPNGVNDQNDTIRYPIVKPK